MDIIARKRRMEGYNVLFPIGYDAFGLPTENFAIKNHMHPAVVTKQQHRPLPRAAQAPGLLLRLRPARSTPPIPAYYKWTQWIFLKLFEHGLAYKSEMPINWCTSCKCGLANEEVVGGVCERCGSEVVRKVKSQWMLKITAYAQKLHRRPGRRGLHRPRQDPADATGSAAARARRSTSPCPPGDKLTRLHHPPGHALRRDLHGHLARASA